MGLRIAILANRRVIGESVAEAIRDVIDEPVAVGSTDPKRVRLKRRPEIVIVVGSQADGSTGSAVATARRRWNDAVVVALADTDRVGDGLDLVRLGADTWLSRSDGVPELRSIIGRIAAGERQLLPPVALAQITSSFSVGQPSRPHRTSRLSARERQVLVCVARGLPRPEIAAMLAISVPTLRTHVQNILRKLELHSIQQAADMAQAEGIIPALGET